MNQAQTTSTPARGRSDRDVIGAIFAALTTASSFAPAGPATIPGADSLDRDPHPVPRFRGWIAR